jgi:hypothetical protein
MGFAHYKDYKKPIFLYFVIEYRNHMRTIIDVKNVIWGKVKDFATVRSISLNCAVEDLLIQSLNQNGYYLQKEEESKK